jgi:nucleoside-diphosphate-sugar epimerase
LDAGHEVLGIDAFTSYYPSSQKWSNLAAALTHPGFRLANMDVEQVTPSAYDKQPDYVFHLAAQPGVRSSWGTGFGEYVRNNVLATQCLLESLRTAPPRRFMQASSSSVYGAADRLPIRETDPLRPISPYGVTKLTAESLCGVYSAECSVPVCILRFFTVYGPRQRPDMALHKFMRAAIAHEPVAVFGTGEQVRDHTYVGDIVTACLATMDLDSKWDVINIGSGRPVSINECLDTLQRISGLQVCRQFLERKHGDPPRTHADVGHARSVLAYEPSVSFEDGLRKQWEWFGNFSASAVAQGH